MDIQKIIFLIVNVVGGLGVLGSYFIGFATHPGASEKLWGNVTPLLKSVYTVTMPLAAIGYFLFAYFILFQLDSKKAMIGDFFGFEALTVIFIIILLPSAMWMPLTFKMIEAPNLQLWWAIRIVLLVIALASLALICALLSLNQREPAWSYWLAVIGSVLFFVETGIMDAFIWPAYFPV